MNGKQCVHEASLFKCEFHSDSNVGGHVVQTAKPETRKWKGISMRMHQLVWTFAKTYGSSCLCHVEGSSYHSIGEVNTNQVGVHKTIFWNQIAHGEASLQWCQILAFLWIVVLFCMGALGGCVALGPLWRLFNLTIFFKKFSDLSYGAHQCQFYILVGEGWLFFARFKTDFKKKPCP